jgi:cadmium resistance transport/sequestration family protein
MMIATIITSVVAFASTNIDDVFVLTLLFSQVDHKMKRSDVVIGQYLGVFSLFGISILATFGLHFINMAHLNLLGIVPIFLGIKTWFDAKKTPKQPQLKTPSAIQTKGWVTKIIRPQILSVYLITVGNGANNIGVYVPLFSEYSPGGLAITTVIFAVMIGMWCYAGYRLASLPLVRAKLLKYKHIVIPIIYIIIGLSVLFD